MAGIETGSVSDGKAKDSGFRQRKWNHIGLAAGMMENNRPNSVKIV
jgi:hypothetical protein